MALLSLSVAYSLITLSPIGLPINKMVVVVGQGCSKTFPSHDCLEKHEQKCSLNIDSNVCIIFFSLDRKNVGKKWV